MVRLELITQIAVPIDRCFDLSRSIEVHLRGTEKTGEQAVGGVTTGLIGPGEYVRWRPASGHPPAPLQPHHRL